MSTTLAPNVHGHGHPSEGAFTAGFALLAAATTGGALVTLLIPDLRWGERATELAILAPPVAAVPGLETAEDLSAPVYLKPDTPDARR
jgi:hypothetical protein